MRQNVRLDTRRLPENLCVLLAQAVELPAMRNNQCGLRNLPLIGHQIALVEQIAHDSLYARVLTRANRVCRIDKDASRSILEHLAHYYCLLQMAQSLLLID